MDIIEHLPRPAARAAAPRGARSSPVASWSCTRPTTAAPSWCWPGCSHAVGIRYPDGEIFGRNHVCFFDDRSLPLALRQAGLAVRLQRQFPYDPSRPGQYVSPLNLAAVTVVEWLGKPFDRVFRMVAYAQKPLAESA